MRRHHVSRVGYHGRGLLYKVACEMGMFTLVSRT